MRILGIDFTSSPSRVQPLWIAHASLTTGSSLPVLCVDRVERHTSFLAFETLLADALGPCVLAIDAPFGLPMVFQEWARLPDRWETMIESIRAMGDRGFEQLIVRFRTLQPEGSKHPLRECDLLAGAASPINIVRPPVGKMFYQCAPRLARTDWRVVPCRESSSDRVAIEGYPALVARAMVGRLSYKGGNDGAARLERGRVRELLLSRLLGEHGDDRLQSKYAMRCTLATAGERDVLLTDEDGDALDSVLCCVQASWAWMRREAGFGIAARACEVEGWITDPATMVLR